MRGARVLVAMLLVAPTLIPLSPGAKAEGSTGDYDLQRARAAMARAAKQVGPMPKKLGEYWAQRPYSFAHPDSEPQYRQQPDGRGFLVRVIPYEVGGGLETIGGHAVVRGADGWWRYAVRGKDGLLHATGEVVLEDRPSMAPGSGRLPEVIWTSEEDLPEMREQLRQYLALKYRTMAAETAQAGEPIVFKVPALLFQIHGEEFQPEHTPEFFENQLNGIGTSPTGTLKEMYLEQSYGNMVVEVDAYGPYTSIVSQPPNDCWYGTDEGPILGEFLGLGGLGSRGMAEEAVPMSDPDVDYTQYDNDSDNWVDFLLIIHTGPGAEATGDGCDVHSHYFGSIAGEPTTTADGKLIGPVMTVPEIDSNIGVTAHELMHALGEPDYYDTSGETQGTGDWDLGAGGSWLGIPAQTNPIHFNPLMKINFGWVDPVRIDDTALNQKLRPRASYGDLLMVPMSIAKAGSDEAELCDQAPVGIEHQNNAFYEEDGDCLVEGFLIENLSRSSARSDFDSCTFAPTDFDRQAYASGLAVWHWDFHSYAQGGNNDPLRYMLDLEEFDRRDDGQELQSGLTRADPLDLFWGDPVGISGATQKVVEGAGIPPPEGSPWTVTGVPGLGAAGTEAQPIPEWTAAATPFGTGMTVSLTWTVPSDDWDLYVDKEIDGEWVQVGESAGGAPQTEERTTIFDYVEGDNFRVRAYNWAGPTSPQAEVSVVYDTGGLTQLGPAGTRDNDLEQTRWAFTNIRPNAYRGFSSASEQAYKAIKLDLIEHGDSSVDVSPDFLRPTGRDPSPVIAGRPISLTTLVYNHGGKAVGNAKFSLYSSKPARGARPLATATVDLGGFDRKAVEFSYTPDAGMNELWVKSSAKGDVAPGNDAVRSELTAYRGGDAQVLIVDHDRNMTQEETYEALLQGLGVSYHVVQGEPSKNMLSRYDAAIWLTTTVSGADGVISSDGIDALEGYLNDGGRLWMSSTRIAGYLGPVLEQDDILARYFGLVAENNTLNSFGTVKGLGADIGGKRSFEIGYLDGRPYLDYGVLAAAGAVKGKATALFEHEALPGKVVGTKVDGEGFRTVYTAFTAGMVNDAKERGRLTREVLGFLGVKRGTTGPNAPSVKMYRFRHVQVGEDLPVVAGAVAPDGIDSVELRYRAYGAGRWKSLKLKGAGSGLYGGTVPGRDVANNGLEYYVRAVTGGGEVVTTAGGAKLPDVASAPYGDPADVAYGECAGRAGPGGGEGDKDGKKGRKGGPAEEEPADRPATQPEAEAEPEAEGAGLAFTGIHILAVILLGMAIVAAGALIAAAARRRG